MRILVRTPLEDTSGFGRDGIGIVSELLNRGHQVDVEPTSAKPPLPPEIANLLTYPQQGVYDLELHHINPGGAFLDPELSSRSRRKVLWTMWEWDNVHASVQDRDRMEFYIPKYDTVVCYTNQTQDVFKQEGFLAEGQESHVVQGGIDVSLWEPVVDASPEYQKTFPYRKYERDVFRFAMVGHLNLRKNVMSVVQAFLELKEEHGDAFNAELILKSKYPPIPLGIEFPGVKVIPEGSWTNTQMKQFYWSIDTLINVSYGEGKDLPSMEATLCGTPVIMNNTPGHVGWNHPSIQTLLPTEKSTTQGHEGRFTSPEHIKVAMLQNYRNRVQIFDQAQRLDTWLRRSVTWDKRLERLGKELSLPL